MLADTPRWKETTGIKAAALLALESAWHQWAAADGMPRRDRFDPMHFPEILPWLLLGEIVDKATDTRPYNVFFRSVGTEFATYFRAQAITRVHLSDVGEPYAERWFLVSDAVRRAKAPCYFKGAPSGTGYEYIALEMLALPLARDDGEIGFLLCAFARLEELLL